MDTATCPRCKQTVNSQAVSCPFCHTQLKAYGHPGIPLHRALNDEYLCNNCIYHADDTCNFPKRPYAKECTLYENIQAYELEQKQKQEANRFDIKLKLWLKRNQFLVLLLCLLLTCFIFTLITSR